MKDIQIPNNWKWTTLKNIATVTTGNPAPQGKEFFEDGIFSFVRVKDMGNLDGEIYIYNTRDKINQKAIKKMKLFPKGSVLFTKSGMSLLLNQRAILPHDMYVVSHIGIATPKENVLSEFLYYWLKIIDFKTFSHRTALPSVQLSKIREIPFPLPPIEVQKQIVKKLNYILIQLEEKIHQISALLEQEKNHIIKLPTNIDNIMFDTILRKKQQNDRRWGKEKLSEITSKITKGIFDMNPSNYISEGIPFIRISDISKNELILDAVKFISKEIHKKHINTSVGPGDIILAKVGATAGSPEKITLIPSSIKSANISQNLIGIIINKELVFPEYLMYYLKFKKMRSIIKGSTLTTFKSIRLDVLRNLIIDLPCVDRQKEVVNEYLKAQNIMTKIDSSEIIRKHEFIEKSLESLKSTVIGIAFSGKLVN